MGIPRVVVVGQTPPPVHGQALAIARLVSAQFSRVEVHHVRMDFSTHIEDLGKVRLTKLWKLASLVWRVLAARYQTGARTLYYPPAGPQMAPVLRDIAFLGIVRPFFSSLILDYHAGGLEDMEAALPAVTRPLFRRAYYDATLAIHKYPPERRVPAQHDVVIPYGINDVYAQYPPPQSTHTGLRLLFVGLLCEGKGIFTLLDAITDIRERGVDVTATFVGEFDSHATATKFYGRLLDRRMSDSVNLPGMLIGEPKWSEFRHADVFCLPSHYENEALPLVIIEAMQFCLPVVASNWRGIPSLVEEGVTGFLVPPRDPHALAARILELAINPTLQARMGRSGRERFLERLTLDSHLAAMEDALVAAATS